MLDIDELYILGYVGYNEPPWNALDGFIIKSGLQLIQDGKLVKDFWWETNGDWKSTNFRLFLRDEFDTPAFKNLVFACDLEFCIEVNE